MASRTRRNARSTGVREANAIAANLGRELRSTRQRRRLRQDQLGEIVGVSQAEISNLEAGRGARTGLETWVSLGIALGRPMAIAFSRDLRGLSDAGHLAAQELVIRIAREGGWRASFETPADPGNPGLTSDVLLDHGGPVLVLVEIWNRFDDLGAASRSSDRKQALVQERHPHRRVASVWLLTDTAANHELVRCYPSIVAARFPGSSTGWIRSLETGAEPPLHSGIAWVDLQARSLRPLRVRPS